MYDFAHGQSDYFSVRTPSATLEFEVHRPFYDYFVDESNWNSTANEAGYRPRPNGIQSFESLPIR